MHVGYFEDFKGRDTLLIEAGVEALRELQGMLESLASGRLKRLVIHKLPAAQIHGTVELRAVCGQHDRGAQRDGAGNSFLWEHTREGWRDAAEKLATLRAPGAGHQYLGAEEDAVVVLVAKGEYGEDWWWGCG